MMDIGLAIAVMSCLVAFAFLFSLLRIEVVYRARCRAIDECYLIGDWSIYDGGDSYDRQMRQIHKWTFRQFYPELAK